MSSIRWVLEGVLSNILQQNSIFDPQLPPVNTGGHKEVTKTKAQLEEEKKVCLSLRIKPIELEGVQLWKIYDAFQMQERQVIN